jgi:hypothetical protein
MGLIFLFLEVRAKAEEKAQIDEFKNLVALIEILIGRSGDIIEAL